MTAKEAGRRMNLTPNWIAILCNRGFIEATKVGNRWEISEEALQAFIRDFDNDLHGWANHNGGINKSDIWGHKRKLGWKMMLFEKQAETYFI